MAGLAQSTPTGSGVAANLEPEADDSASLGLAVELVVDYFRGFGLDDRTQLYALASAALLRAARRRAHLDNPLRLGRAALAVAEQMVADWSARVLGRLAQDPREMASLGRAAFLLSDMPVRAPKIFLAKGEVPEELAVAMRQALPQPVPAERPAVMPVHRFVPSRFRWRGLRRTLVRGWARARRRLLRPWRRRRAEPRRVRRIEIYARRRQAILLSLAGLSTALATGAIFYLMAGSGLQFLEIALGLLFALNFAWIGVSFWTAVAGFVTILRGGDPVALAPWRPQRPAVEGRRRQSNRPNKAHTAIVMPVCNEETAKVFARIEAVWRSLQATGAEAGFEVFILSDSTDEACHRSETEAWWALVRRTGGHGRIFYRHRSVNTDRKSGNLADFCRRWGTRYRYMVVLDADSLMSGETLVQLVQTMDDNPSVGLIQTLPAAVNRRSLFGRIQQFATRLYRPVVSVGMHYWQLGHGSYWGHNAIIRVRPFIRHCGLPHLPGREPLGGAILSHDFVEAALLRQAGWEVWSVPSQGGSYEESPPTLIDHAKRDRRWCQGNLQHLRLLFVRGLSALSRIYLGIGGMAYLSSVLWLLFLVVSVLAAMEPGVQGAFEHALDSFTRRAESGLPPLALCLAATTVAMLFLPKLLALTLALRDRRLSRGYGGRPRLALSGLLEMVFAVLVAPIMMIFHSIIVGEILLGRSIGWASQRRGDEGTGLREACARHWPHTLAGILLAVGAASVAPQLFWWLSPAFLGLLLSIPLSMISSQQRWGQAAQRHGLFLTPEETAPPAVVLNFHQTWPTLEMQLGGRPVPAPFDRSLQDRRNAALHEALPVLPATPPAPKVPPTPNNGRQGLNAA